MNAARRRLPGLLAAGALPPAWALPPKALRFPRDFGSHPDLQTEWWYITGHVQAQGRSYGFQLTFFRSRVASTQNLRSAFAARQLLFAHAALSDIGAGRLLHDQRMARAGLGLAEASLDDTAVHIGDWHLRRSARDGEPAALASRYDCALTSREFALHLRFDTTQPVLLQGAQGLSRKGPEPDQASYYYSQPQLAVAGEIMLGGRRLPVESGRAWLDHECSDALLHAEAQGWDWTGMNLHDGSALTAFQLRRPDGSALYSGGSWRASGGPVQSFTQGQLQFKPLRHWTSPHSKARYAVDWELATPQGRFEIRALADDQELDSRASTGAIYWEGLSELRRLRPGGGSERAGLGYLEMTGYANALSL